MVTFKCYTSYLNKEYADLEQHSPREESIEAGMMMRGEGNVLPLLQVIGHIANMITRIEGIIIVTMRGKIVNILTDRDDQTDLMKMEKTGERAQGVL